MKSKMMMGVVMGLWSATLAAGCVASRKSACDCERDCMGVQRLELQKPPGVREAGGVP